MPLRNRDSKRRRKEKIQQLMKTVSIFKPLLRPRLKLLSFKKCLLPVSRLSSKRLLLMLKGSRMNHPLSQLSKRKMTVTLKQLRRSRPKWLLLKKQ